MDRPAQCHRFIPLIVDCAVLKKINFICCNFPVYDHRYQKNYPEKKPEQIHRTDHIGHFTLCPPLYSFSEQLY
jgi:hypothetical protein